MNTATETHEERLAAAHALKARVDAAIRKSEPRGYSVDEVAALENVNRNTIYGLVKTGELGHYKIGRLIRITQAHLDAFRAGTAGTPGA